MAQNLLTDENIEKAKAANNRLIEYPGKIKQCIETIMYTIREQEVSGWLEGTEVGRANKEKILANCRALDMLAGQLQDLYQVTEQLIARSILNNASE